MAIRWRAALSWRLPPRLSRNRSALPDQTGHGRGAVVAGERRPAAEALDAAPSRPTILAATSAPQPRYARRVGASAATRTAELALERDDRRAQLADPGDEVARDPGDDPLKGVEAPIEGVEHARLARATRGGGSSPGMQLVEVPAQPVLDLGPVRDQVLAVIHEQAHLALGAVEPGDRQVGLAQRRPGDRERVDRVALAAAPGRSAGRRP